ncbi:hypothetical protein NA57DRAFT_78987 [Rhizodiscina lignyota]|uniref:Ankyrin repeat protein n=1 Tax=Rhizodiscina lignyota TaxID=1504668 RepID=A0A9P4M7W6_9PEZI|nr:hypothetical protein NA57DRAFT_78987 [Rhizodiscina lignyota]
MELGTSTTGATPLHLAIYRGSFKVVEFLIRKKANVCAMTWEGETVLHIALQSAWDDESVGAQANNTGGGNRILDHIIKNIDKGKQWQELLNVARREENRSRLKYLVERMDNGDMTRWMPLERIWLAMSEKRFHGLKDNLRAEVGLNAFTSNMKQELTGNCDVLKLAACLGEDEIVRWLLRTRHWSESEKEEAKKRTKRPQWVTKEAFERLNDGKLIWDTPFVRDGKRAAEKFRRPSPKGLAESLHENKLKAAIMDFVVHDQQVDFMYFDRDVSQIIYGKDGAAGGETLKKFAKDAATQLEDPTIFQPELRGKWPSFRWIHLPANCIDWMNDITLSIYLEKDTRKDNWQSTLQSLRQSWDELPQNESMGRYMHPKCVEINVAPTWSKLSDDERSRKPDCERRLALYMPYITFGPCGTKSKVLSYEETLRDKHKHHILHSSRTLDQYSHNIEDKKRDLDQVVTRYIDWMKHSDEENGGYLEKRYSLKSKRKELLKNEHPTKEKHDCTNCEFEILRVDQLWLWVIDENTIVSCGTRPLDGRDDQIFKRLLDRLCECQSKLDGNAIPSSLESLVTFITSFYINIVDNLTTKILVPTRTSPTNIRDELMIISSVVQSQKTVWDQLSKSASQTKEERVDTDQWTTSDPNYVLDHIKDLLRYSEETQRNIDSILSLEMNQLSASEGEETRIQGEILMVFTVVTVVFLPLSFLSSLFALNVTIFPHEEGDLLYRPGWIFGIIFGTTAVFILLLAPFLPLEIFRKRIRMIFFRKERSQEKRRWGIRRKARGPTDTVGSV